MITPTEKKCITEQIQEIRDYLTNHVKTCLDQNERDHVWFKWGLGLVAAMGVATVVGSVATLVIIILTR